MAAAVGSSWPTLEMRSGATPDARPRDLAPSFRRVALSVESSGNLVLITTPAGFAAALSQVIDQASHPQILGTIAGDNTIMVVAREGITGRKLRDELRGMLLEGAA